jgi:hypothetical protein
MATYADWIQASMPGSKGPKGRPTKSNGDSELDEVVHMLALKGIHLPAYTTEDNLLSHLRVALHAVTRGGTSTGEDAAGTGRMRDPEEDPLQMSTLAMPSASQAYLFAAGGMHGERPGKPSVFLRRDIAERARPVSRK